MRRRLTVAPASVAASASVLKQVSFATNEAGASVAAAGDSAFSSVITAAMGSCNSITGVRMNAAILNTGQSAIKVAAAPTSGGYGGVSNHVALRAKQIKSRISL